MIRDQGRYFPITFTGRPRHEDDHRGAFIRVLQMHGIEHAFGTIGSAMMPISDPFPQAGIKFWDCAQECNPAGEPISKADVVLSPGTRLNPFSTLPGYGIDCWPKGAKIIQADINASRSCFRG